MNTTPATTPETHIPPVSSSNNKNTDRNNTKRHTNVGNENKPNGKFNNNRSKFRGNTDDMNGHVFQTHDESNNKQQFFKTLEALQEYINKHLDHPGDVSSLCDDFTVVDVSKHEPQDLDPTITSAAKKRIWEKQLDHYVVRINTLGDNLLHLWSVIWGQCSYNMQTKLKAHGSFTIKRSATDCAWLLKEIKGVTNAFETTKLIFVSLDKALQSYYTTYQTKNQNLDTFYKDFKAQVEVLEHYGANLGADDAYIKEVERTTTTLVKPTDVSSASSLLFDATAKQKFDTDMISYNSKVRKISRNRAIAISFIRRADRGRYGALWLDLQNQYSRGHDQYPTDLTNAYELLLNFLPPESNHLKNITNRPHHRSQPALQFMSAGTKVAGTDGTTHDGITCYECKDEGHYASSCPKKGKKGPKKLTMQHVTALQVVLQNESSDPNTSNMTFVQNYKSPIPSSWVLLDSQSTVSVFRSPDLLSNIRRSSETLTVLTNGGPQLSDWVGTSSLFGQVWYNPSSLANILSLALVRKRYRVTMDTSIDPALNVHLPNGVIIRFCEFESGLYYFDSKHLTHNSTNSQLIQYSPPPSSHTFLQSVANNKQNFTRREIAHADRARRLYRHLGRPSEQQFQDILQKNLLRDCPVTPDDAKRAYHIYGPDLATLKGKTTNSTQPHVPTYRRVDIPAPILIEHNHITLCVDFMYLNGNPFLHTISKSICFRTISSVTSRSANTILRELRAVVRLYASRSLEVVCITGDQEFECVQDDFSPIFMDIVDKDAHVPEIERSIRTVKERIRSTLHGMPFKSVPRLIIRGLAEFAVQSLNQLPALNGVSSTLSPHTIITGQQPRGYRQYQLDFGTYVQVFEDNDPSNTTKSRTTGAISLNHSRSSSGGYHFLSLVTGLRLARRQWTEVPMPEWVPKYVEDMAASEKQQVFINNEPLWEWRPGVPFVDNTPPEADLQPLADPPLDVDFPPLPLRQPRPHADDPVINLPPLPIEPAQPVVSDHESLATSVDHDSDLSFDDSS